MPFANCRALSTCSWERHLRIDVKQAERNGNGGRRRRRFEAERALHVELLLPSRVNHRNLVQLLGFCGERILVFSTTTYTRQQQPRWLTRRAALTRSASRSSTTFAAAPHQLL